MKQLSQEVDYKALIEAVNTVIFGKQQQIKLALTCLFARGHILFEDLPGMGKTTLSHALAKVLGLTYQRVQFTNDLLPADILGVNIYNQQTQSFEFIKGPVFTQVLLADEINRTTSKTQSALLEAMEEGQVSISGTTYPLEQPFFVIATQNPESQLGTYPLPESQIDRFLMRLSLGYPSGEFEKMILKNQDISKLVKNLQAIITPKQVLQIQEQVKQIHISDAIADYIWRILDYSRTHKDFAVGLSPRAGLALALASKSYALIEGRDYVAPEDVQAVLPAVASHRLSTTFEQGGVSLVDKILNSVPVVNL